MCATPTGYISCELVKQAIEAAPAVEAEAKAYREGYKEGYDDGVMVAQPEQGQWINIVSKCYGGGTLHEVACSICGESWLMPTAFCPCCGADMREHLANESKEIANT